MATEPYTDHLKPCKMCGDRRGVFFAIPTLPFQYDVQRYGYPCLGCYEALIKCKSQEEFDKMLPKRRETRLRQRKERANGDYDYDEHERDASTRSEAEGASGESEGWDKGWDS